jgi:hypothetical protein
VQQFAQKVLAGETTDMASLISPKAKGWLKKLHDGENSDASVTEKLEKLKTALANAQITSDKQTTGLHVVVMEEGGQQNQGYGAPGGNPYGGAEGGKAKKHKRGKTVQFKVTSDFLILEVNVN